MLVRRRIFRLSKILLGDGIAHIEKVYRIVLKEAESPSHQLCISKIHLCFGVDGPRLLEFSAQVSAGHIRFPVVRARIGIPLFGDEGGAKIGLCFQEDVLEGFHKKNRE